MNLRTTVKLIANTIVGIGAYGITRQVIDNNTDEPESKTQVVLHEAGSVAVAGLVADAASDRVNNTIDELFDYFSGNKNDSTD